MKTTNSRNYILKSLIFSAIISSGIMGFVACEEYTYDPGRLDPNRVISFSDDLIPIFEEKCVSCHGGALSPNLSKDKAYNTLTTKGYISDDPENTPEESGIYTKLAAGHSTAVTELEINMILQWIRQGAENN